MKTKLFSVLGPAVALVLGGCATGIVHIATIEPFSDEAKAARVSVFIPPEEHHRDDPIGFGKSAHFPSGEVFAMIFNGTDPAGPSLEIRETKATASLADVGFTAVYVYRITAVLHVRDESHLLKSEGNEHAHGFRSPAVYAQAACEKACVDLVNQITPLLSRPH